MDGDEAAAFFATEAWIDAPAAISRLAAAIVALGGRFVRRPVTGFTRTDRSLESVVLSDGSTFTADQFVLAGGAQSSELGALADINVPVLPATDAKVPGLVVSISSPIPSPGPIILAPGIIIQPFGSGRSLLAGDDHGRVLKIGSSRNDLVLAAEVLLHRAGIRVPQLASAAILDVRLSSRPIPKDGLTIAGPAIDTDNAYLLTTHSGFTLAPLLGRLASREVLGGAADEALEPYRPSRFDRGAVDSVVSDRTGRLVRR